MPFCRAPAWRILRAALLVATSGAIGGCRGTAPRLGADLAGAKATSQDLFGGIGVRYDNVVRERKVLVGRRLIMKNMLVPSRVFGDTAAWLWAPNTTTRMLAFRGVGERDRYRFVADGLVSPPANPGDGRHDIRLRRLAIDDEYEWLATSDYGVGATTPLAFANIPVAWIAGGERADTAAIRSDLRTAFSKSSTEWGRLFTLESISTSRDASGAWTQRAVVTLHTDRAGVTYPALGKWLRSYISPLRVRMRLRNSSQTWFDAVIQNDSLTVTFRSRDGRVLPLEGGNAFLPDTATLETDFSAKLRFFRVGFHALRTEFVTVRRPNTRGWSLRFMQEPKWDLPPLTERMLRSPLRRPFSGGGSLFRVVAVTDTAARQTVLARRIQAPVHESTIYRFLSNLIAGGISDYVEGGADRELNAWLSKSFRALRDDTQAILAGSER